MKKTGKGLRARDYAQSHPFALEDAGAALAGRSAVGFSEVYGLAD
jgi:hypothetical protein